jgi:hypothetical protein
LETRVSHQVSKTRRAQEYQTMEGNNLNLLMVSSISAMNNCQIGST